MSVLRSKFKLVDIEELRGMEFHQFCLENPICRAIMELQLQKVTKRAFPTLVGKDLDFKHSSPNGR